MKSLIAIFFILFSFTTFSQERTKSQGWEHAIFIVNHDGNQLIKYTVNYTSSPSSQQITQSEQELLGNDMITDVLFNSNGMTIYAIQGYETPDDVIATLNENGIQATVSMPIIVPVNSQEVKNIVAKYH